MQEIKKLLTPYNVGQTKKRYGSEFDGGYILSEDLVNTCKRVYSLGVANEFSIDIQMAEMGKMVYQYDINFCQTPQTPNMKFKQLFIDNNTLKSELIETGGIDDDSNLLLMDIEGGEYDVILNSEDLLKNFSQISLELHFITFEKKVKSLLEKLNQTHTLIHLHANNVVLSTQHENFIKGKGVVDDIPDLLELTYIKNDKFTDKEIMKEKIPTSIDKKNLPNLPEVEISWWLTNN
jgi:hypothetical protein